MKRVIVKFNDTIAYTVVIRVNTSIGADSVIFIICLQDVALKYFVVLPHQ